MTTEHDEALVGRVALAMFNQSQRVSRPYVATFDCIGQAAAVLWMQKARSVIYPPAPPKTRLQVARELCAAECKREGRDRTAAGVLAGDFDNDSEMRAVIAALALPAMED